MNNFFRGVIVAILLSLAIYYIVFWNYPNLEQIQDFCPINTTASVIEQTNKANFVYCLSTEIKDKKRNNI